MSEPKTRAEAIEKAREKIEAAFAEIARVCNERRNGREGWQTSIPARPSDTDMILGDALIAARAALALPPDAPEPDARLARVVALVQQFQPRGSPIPGDETTLVEWVLCGVRALVEAVERVVVTARPMIGGEQVVGYTHQTGAMHSLLAAVREVGSSVSFTSVAPAPEGEALPSVQGGACLRTMADFERACRVLILDEQAKIAPDTALISVLCDAVRLSREYTASRGAPEDDEAAVERAAEAIQACVRGGTPTSNVYADMARAALRDARRKP